MNLSLWLLTSACVAGQVPHINGRPVTLPVGGQQVISSSEEAPVRRGLLSDFCDKVLRRPTAQVMRTTPGEKVIYIDKASVPMQMMQTSSPVVVQQAMPMQSSQFVPVNGQVVVEQSMQMAPMPVQVMGSKNNGVVQVSHQTPAAQPTGLQVRKELQSKIGHADDYAWVTGQLCLSAEHGNQWVVRYTSPLEPDQYGGCAVLALGVSLNGCRDGDLVCINGQVTGAIRSGQAVTHCFYQVSAMNLIERQKQ